jgi:prepilin-type processing-associated H-X9-DG protein
MNSDHRNPVIGQFLRVGDGRSAFTVTELLVVLATVGILAVVLLPALASTQPAGAKAFQCLNNMRQLGLAESLYANDNQDRLASNSDRNNYPVANQNWICPALGGTAVVLDWTSSPNNTNILFLTIDGLILGQRTTALFGNYVARSVNIFLCPTDNNLSAVQRAMGWKHRMRSCAMNGAIGDGSKWFGFKADGTPNGGHASMPAFYQVKKTSDIHSPTPANCFVILDENPESDDDATFYINPAYANGSGVTFLELPGAIHNNAAGMNFADGHAEMHLWKGRVTTQPLNPNYSSYLQGVGGVDAASVNDNTWLAQHTPAN